MSHPSRCKIMMVLLLFMLASGCVPSTIPIDTLEESRARFEKLYARVQAEKLIEPFPFHNPFELAPPTEQEKKGILLRPLRDRKLRLSASYVSKSVTASLGASSETFLLTDSSDSISLEMSEKLDDSNWSSIYYKNDGSAHTYKKGFSPSPPSNISANWTKTFDVRVDNRNISVRNEETTVNGEKIFQPTATTQSNRTTYTTESSHVVTEGFRDIETDEEVRFFILESQYPMFLTMLPEKSVRPGDQWESQLNHYSNITYDRKIGGKSATAGSSIHLYTFELVGFDNVAGRRCAIIEYVKEMYGMGRGRSEVQEITAKEVKEFAKTLSKSSIENIRAYTKATHLEEVNKISSASSNKTSSVSQSGEKHYGIFAFDYEKGIILEHHRGVQNIWGLGIYVDVNVDRPTELSIPMKMIQRRQLVYKTIDIK